MDSEPTVSFGLAIIPKGKSQNTGLVLAPLPLPAYIRSIMFIETETTPNPSTLKFLPGEQVMASGTRDFASPEAAAASPLAEALFDTGEVTNVLFGRDFVAVTAAPGAKGTQLRRASWR